MEDLTLYRSIRSPIMKKDYRNKGFTLVEMIVVIVIIGILLAILVPGMFRYIQKAKEQQAIVECRAVVTAADTMALELYAKDLFDPLTFLPNNKNSIINQANAKGEIQSLSFEVSKPTLQNLTYITESKIKVLYDTTQASVYQIVSEGKFSENASGYYSYSEQKWSDPSVQGEKGNDAQNKALQKLLYNEYGNIKLSASEKELFQKISNKKNWDAYNWKPIHTNDGNLILAANTADYDPEQSKCANASLIYYNNNYYYFYGNKDNPVGSVFVGINFNTAQLDTAVVSPSKGDTDKWIKIEIP